MKNFKKILLLAVALSLVLGLYIGKLIFTSDPDPVSPDNPVQQTNIDDVEVEEDGVYTSRDEVALYIITYHKLPSNYISKTKAKKLGWDQDAGNLHDVCKGCSIGGGPYNNLEEILPVDEEYYECDIDYTGGHRNAKRLVYTKWGTVYYTDDHYESFVMLYGDEND